jgi:hypothetical protein
MQLDKSSGQSRGYDVYVDAREYKNHCKVTQGRPEGSVGGCLIPQQKRQSAVGLVSL